MVRTVVVVVLASLLAWPAAAQEAGWSLGPRLLPPPTHASPRLRRVLTDAPAPDVRAAEAKVPRTVAGWKALVAQADAAGARLAERLVAETGVTVTEVRVGGVHAYRITPPTVAPEHRDHLLVFAHGGAFVEGRGLAGILEPLWIARSLGLPVLAVDYRVAPDDPAPAASDDLVAVWRQVVAERPAATTALGGTSAGANLVLVATQRLIAAGLPRPGALFVGTPPIDLAKHGDSRFLNEGVDRHLVSWDALPAAAVALYAHGRALDDPLLSPVYGDFAGFPPTYLITGTRDLLLSDTVVAHRRLRRAGVEADLHVYEGQGHADYVMLPESGEAKEHLRELDLFLRRHLTPAGAP